MNLKTFRIGTQLKIGFSVLMLFVLVLGAVSHLQTDKIHQQTVDIYNHPMMVQRAIGTLRSDILTIQRDMKDLFLGVGETEIAFELNRIETSRASAIEQIGIIYRHYLGPRTDIDSAKQAFATWSSIQNESIRLFQTRKIAEAANRTNSTGVGGKQAEVVLAALQKIDDFARNKGEELFVKSGELNELLNRQLLLLVVAILLLSLIINFILLRNIRTPLKILSDAARRFHEGDMETRSSYASANEFGVLSASFNTLAESIQANTDLSEKAANLARIMLSEDDAKVFFRTTLAALATHTGSQVAAAYLLSDDKKTFVHFASIGLNDNARPSFAADSFEGEFGAALASRETQHLSCVTEDTRFLFHTTCGTFIPREIITIPIENNDVVAVISLATVGMYGKQVLQLIDNIHATLNSRIEGILAYHKIKEFSAKLEHQNSELEAQKTELTSQSSELTVQNSELEMQKKQLDGASRLKTNFLSNMSHELRTPLNSVIALSGVLGRRLANKIPEEEYSYLEVIGRNGKLLLLLINDILDISRIEAGREEIEITTFNANSLIADVAGMIQPQAEQKCIELLHAGSEVNLTVTSDARKCRHILQNLIGNAVKFTETGRVAINSRQNNKNIEITVTDTGIGIDSTHLPHIFDEFRQADGSTSRKFGGTGLGLAIAKKYANLLGGTIFVSSSPGTGSEFRLVLPARYVAENRINETESQDYSKHPVTRAPHHPAPGSAVKTILLVEDSEPAIIQLKNILEERDYQILVARDGGEALDIIAHTIPDAMILDLMMPGIDGFEVLRVIREAERTAHIPVLILTAKHITNEELNFLTRNNVRQLIQKGDVNRCELQNAVAAMVFPEAVETVKPRREQQSFQGKPVLLVVEDNPDNMLTVKALLADNFTVIEAVDGNEGIEMAGKHIPHLILMDIALPGMNGIEAFKTIRKDPRLQHVPIIALTASAMVSDRETILAHGFDDYIAKPIDEKLFFRSIRGALYGD